MRMKRKPMETSLSQIRLKMVIGAYEKAVPANKLRSPPFLLNPNLVPTPRIAKSAIHPTTKVPKLTRGFGFPSRKKKSLGVKPARPDEIPPTTTIAAAQIRCKEGLSLRILMSGSPEERVSRGVSLESSILDSTFSDPDLRNLFEATPNSEREYLLSLP